MENYQKGKNVEEPLTRESVPFPGLQKNFLWMQVTGSSRMQNLLSHALSSLETEPLIVWSGSGPALQKVISCVEIVKRKYSLHQVNRVCYRTVEEYWDPVSDGLETLVVKRDVPTIHVLLSKLPLDCNQPGYQAPRKSVEERVQPSKSVPGKAPKRQKNKERSEKLRQFTQKE